MTVRWGLKCSSVSGFLAAVRPFYVRAGNFWIHQRTKNGYGFFTLQEKLDEIDKGDENEQRLQKEIHFIDNELQGAGFRSNKHNQLTDFTSILGKTTGQIGDMFASWLNNGDDIYQEFITTIAKIMKKNKLDEFIVQSAIRDNAPFRYIQENTTYFDDIDEGDTGDDWKVKFYYDVAANMLYLTAAHADKTASNYDLNNSLRYTITLSSSQEYTSQVKRYPYNASANFAIQGHNNYFDGNDMTVEVDDTFKTFKEWLAGTGALASDSVIGSSKARLNKFCVIGGDINTGRVDSVNSDSSASITKADNNQDGYEYYEGEVYYPNKAFEDILRTDLGNNITWNKDTGKNGY